MPATDAPARPPAGPSPVVAFGTAGWQYKDWVGPVYPPGTRPADQLPYLAEYVDGVEVNSTFYRPATPSQASGWVKRTRDGFWFTAKLWQRFTHEPQPWEAADAEQAAAAFRVLRDAGRLGAVVCQFPWSFKNDETSRGRIGRIREAFPDLPLVCEVRHRSFDLPAFRSYLASLGMGLVAIDQPVFRDCIGPSSEAVADLGYVRLHGRNYQKWWRHERSEERYDYLYPEAELREWVPRLRQMAGAARRVFVIANNHARGQALANVLQLEAFFREAPSKVPPGLLSAYPALASIAARSP